MLLNKTIKKICLIATIMLTLCVNAQDTLPAAPIYTYNQGYRFINRAKKYIFFGSYKQAEKLLTKAEKANFGFCGNSWAAALSDIGTLKAKIYIKQEKYSKALLILDSIAGCSLGADCETRDNLKVTALIGKFGKEKVQIAFRAAVPIKPGDDFTREYVVFLPSLDYTFRFENINSRPKTEEDVKPLITKQSFYSLLQ